jgi:glycosyltransferase 2 family protein
MKVLRLVAQVGLLALCLIPVGRQLTQDGASLLELASGLDWGVVAGAAALLMLASLGLPVAMAAFARGGSQPIGWRGSALAYFASQPMKYLPGGFWMLPGRVVLLQRMGYDAAVSAGGLLFEIAAQTLSGALVAAGLLAAGPGLASRAPAWTGVGIGVVLVGSALACGLLLACPAALQRWQRVPASVREAAARLAEIPARTRFANLALTLLAFGAMWLLTGVSFYLLLVAEQPRLDGALLLTAVGVSTLSFLAGLLTPVSPGGIGVREAAIVLLLAGVTTGPQAALVAVLSRVLALVVELGFAAVAWVVLRAQKPTGIRVRVRLGAQIVCGVRRASGAFPLSFRSASKARERSSRSALQNSPHYEKRLKA